MGFILGVVIGGVVVWLIARRRPGAALQVKPGEQLSRTDLARAWQEGYDAGSVAVASPAASTPMPAAEPALEETSTEETSTGELRRALVPAASIAPLPAGQPVAHPPSRPPRLPASPPPTSLPPPSLPPPSPPSTPEELAAAKDRRDRRNVNITLYTACFLLVAAASLFIGAALPVTARVAGLAVVVGLFSVGGLVVHALSRTLRPAAIAFTGTGLALVPVAGVALDLLVLQNPAVSWFITSAVGTVMMVVAAVRLDSRVVTYLTVPFLLSTVMASGAAVQQGMVWALIASIGLAVLMAWLSVDTVDAVDDVDNGEVGPTLTLSTQPLPTRRNRWLPVAYRTAIARTHQWIVPGMVAAGLLVGVWIEPVQMFMLLLAACAYYMTVAVIGPVRYRLASSYAVRIGLFVALVPWGLMLEGSATLILTSMVVYLCLQIPLVWWGSRWWGRARGYLPTDVAVWIDHGVSWILAVFLAVMAQIALVLEDVPGLGLAAALLALTTAVFSILFVHGNRLVDSGSPGSANVVWQATTPLAMVPMLAQPTGAEHGIRGWNLEIILLVTMAVQAVILTVLVRGGYRGRLDARIAPHVIAAATVALVYLVADGSVVDQFGAGPETPWPVLLTALAALMWATVTALRSSPLAAGALATRPAALPPTLPTALPTALPATVWSGATLLALLLLLGPTLDSWEVLAGWYALVLVTGGVSLWWLGRGEPQKQRADDAGQAPPTQAPPTQAPPTHTLQFVVVAVGIVVLGAATLRLSTVGPTQGIDGGLAPWHPVIALALVTGWLVAAAVVTRTRLPQPVRAGLLLAGQATSAVLVSTVVDRLGGDDSAARAAAAVALTAGMALRWRFARGLVDPGRDRTRGWAAALSGDSASWLVTAALGVLWIVELGLGGDRAALMVIALTLMAAGLVLRVARGGHWALLTGAMAFVVAATDWLGLFGGWLPDALFPTSAAVAVLLLLALGVTAREIVSSRSARTTGASTTEPATAADGPAGEFGWITDLTVFRPAAVAVLWFVGVVLGLSAGPEHDPHDGALGISAAVAALACYVFARTRGLVALVCGTVVGVPVAVWFLLAWGEERAPWFPNAAWGGVLVGVCSLTVLGLWSVVDARRASRQAEDRTAAMSRIPIGPAVLWQGGLAVLLVTAVGTVLDLGLGVGLRAGMPEDAAVWTACGLGVLSVWLTVDA